MISVCAVGERANVPHRCSVRAVDERLEARVIGEPERERQLAHRAVRPHRARLATHARSIGART